MAPFRPFLQNHLPYNETIPQQIERMSQYGDGKKTYRLFKYAFLERSVSVLSVHFDCWKSCDNEQTTNKII